jgi:hypothetical protein
MLTFLWVVILLKICTGVEIMASLGGKSLLNIYTGGHAALS